MRVNRNRWLVVLGMVVGMGASISCREDRTSAARGDAEMVSEGSAATPLEAARWLHDLHERREYGRLARLIVEEHRPSTLQLLIALDDVIDANADLRRTAEIVYSGPQTEQWDLTSMENNLGVFSKTVSFINVIYRGDTAEVTLQQGDFLPLVHESFVLLDDRWLLRPASVPEQMSVELHELSRLLRVMEAEVARGASLNTYVDGFFYRVIPQMRRVSTAGDARPPPVMAAGALDAD